MDSDSDDATLLALMVIHACKKKIERKKKKRSIWMKEWLKRRCVSSHVHLLKDLEVTAPSDFKNFLRMDSETYMELLNLTAPLIEKQDTCMRPAITPNERLSATLRYLSSGQSFEDLKFLTTISPQSLGLIVIETCEAIISVLRKYIKVSLF